METPPAQLSFGQNVKAGVEERAMGVPIDTRRVVPSLVEPGDMVTFIVPGSGLETPTPASGDDEPGKADGGSPSPSVKPEPGKAEPAKTSPLKPTPAWSASRPPSGTPDLIGPFKVLSMGNRLGSTEVMRANRIPQSQENVMLILVHVEKDKNNKWRLEPEAEKLERILEESNNRPLTLLCPIRGPRDRSEMKVWYNKINESRRSMVEVGRLPKSPSAAIPANTVVPAKPAGLAAPRRGAPGQRQAAPGERGAE